MLNQEQIESVESRLLNIINSRNSTTEDVIKAVESLQEWYSMQAVLAEKEVLVEDEDEETFTDATEGSIISTVDKVLEGSEYKLFSPVQESSEGHYVATLCGGDNGSGNWPKYLNELVEILHKFDDLDYDAWVIDLDNDCLDDVHTVRIGFN